MPGPLAQQPIPSAASGPPGLGRARELTGWAGIAAVLLIIVLVCAVAMIGRHWARSAAGLAVRGHGRAGQGKKTDRSAAGVDPWVEAGRRLEPDNGDEDETGRG